MADDDPKGSFRADDDPKGSFRADDDPKASFRADDDPKGSFRAGDDPFGLGRSSAGASPAGGWGVVAFVGPVGMNVPDLALRALRGQPMASRPGTGRRVKAISNLFTIAANEARKQLRDREYALRVVKPKQE